ncbi:winged helix-turn-helix transcriptional regulator [Skermania piniformis]|uniref:Winged helix-turn-helix transcriptional regulator n=1 Tax=Skermania pinensis TaxID=39122 RepID=A0ABX8S456_9ACTN|nr:winged helix-turn-helix transcriptional regulator [Skermania piniformis]QXQ12618.1 winged helix-turn-helix transcriptional regulator [Skermania piniformis]
MPGRGRNTAQREHILAELKGADAPLDAGQLADRVGIHVSTARFHLKKLIDTGRITSHTLRLTSAGRPRVGYRAVPDPPVGELVGLLLDRLAGTPEIREHLAVDAGRAWAASRVVPHTATELPDPLTLTQEALQRFGFQISSSMSAFGTHELRICSCPLRDIAERHPEIARGVVRGLVEQSLAGSSPALARQYAVAVLPDPTGGNCEITLRLARSDTWQNKGCLS